jgi:hypothetical protein
MCCGPEEHRLAIEEHGRVSLLHPVDELVRDIVDGSQVGCQPWRTPKLDQKLRDAIRQRE